MKILTYFFALSLLLGASTVSAQSIESQLTGSWNMKAVYELDKDVTAEHNPKVNRYARFTADNRFETGGDPYGKNTGSWKWLEDEQLLFLDSDAGEEDDSYWSVSFEGDEMTWKGAKFDFSKRFTIVHIRTGD